MRDCTIVFLFAFVAVTQARRVRTAETAPGVLTSSESATSLMANSALSALILKVSNPSATFNSPAVFSRSHELHASRSAVIARPTMIARSIVMEEALPGEPIVEKAPVGDRGNQQAASTQRADGMSEQSIKLTWEEGFAQELTSLLSQDKEESTTATQPLLVAIVGIPGAGKSTSAAAIGRLIGTSCLVLPMDGFHYSLAELRARPDAADAIYRRGAPDTFDAPALRKALLAIRDDKGQEEVSFPGFDHAAGDPVPGTYRFVRGLHRIVLVEGLYLLHNSEDWAGIPGLFNRSIFIDSDIDAAVARLKIRNRCIPGYTPEEIDIRCEKVDRCNAIVVKETIKRAGRIVKGCA